MPDGLDGENSRLAEVVPGAVKLRRGWGGHDTTDTMALPPEWAALCVEGPSTVPVSVKPNRPTY